MGAIGSISVLYLLVISSTICLALSENQPSIDLTSYFEVSATSTCGDPPTFFDSPKNSGQFGICSGTNYSIDNVIDGDNTTRWQSANGDSPVDVTFTLAQPDIVLSLQSVRVTVMFGLPLRLYLEELRANEQNFTTLRVYVLDAATDCAGIANCEEYTVEEFLLDGAIVLLCPATFSESVSEVRLRMDGFQSHFQNTTSQYYVLYEVNLIGWLADGYYVRSLTAIMVEGEIGYPVLLDPTPVEPVSTSTDEALIAGFSSRGFATFSFDFLSQELFEWEFPSIPLTTSYQIWMRYTNPGSDIPLTAMVISGELFSNARIFFKNCPPPNACHTPLSFPNDITSIATFTLIGGDSTVVTLTITGIVLHLDVIFAVPMAFYDATGLLERDRFLQSCDFIGGLLGEGTSDEQFCLESAVQLSLELYQFTYVCGCGDVGAVGDGCEVYGGQCDCIDQSDGFSRITGRRCDMCPFMTYLTPNGCTDCDCVNSANNDCDVTTGQCSCPPLVTGRTCDTCMVNTYGDPLTGCSVCTCDIIGTEYCNNTTGECVCKDGVMGVTCDMCEVGQFNLSSLGCQECGCDNIGSISSECDNITGQCTCKSNVGGLQCSSCLPGSYFISSDGCTLCNCSDRTSDCSQNPNVTVEPSEVCNCPAPYVGVSCDQCDVGWYMSVATGNCEECQCNGFADSCLDGNGSCVSCRGNTTGAGCDVCIDGYYDADPTDPGIMCLPCPCSIITAMDTLCVPDSIGNPICNCRQGHEGQTCDFCSDGYFGAPPDFRCTQCDCNNNIDPLVPGSCDIITGQCIKCINNSTGNECEICAAGYYGDAIQQDCQPCDCNVPGSEGTVCDSATGQCSCLPGVNGLRCEQCLPTYWNFTAMVGCQSCVCEGSVVSDMCDVVTGECECSEGVGGSDCSYCIDGYFNYTSIGCTFCGCGEGAVNDSCSSDGQCYCQPGVGGVKCDLCQPFTFNLSTTGCESCGDCELELRDDLERESDILNNVSREVELVMQLSEVDMRGLEEVERVRDEVRQNAESVGVMLVAMETEVDDLNGSYIVTDNIIRKIQDRIDNSSMLTFELQPVAEDVGNYIQDVYNDVQNGISNLVDTIQYTQYVQPLVMEWAELATEITNNITRLLESHSGNYSNDVVVVMEMVERANQIAARAENIRNLWLSLNREADNLIGRYQDIINDVNMSSISIEGVNEILERVQSSLDEAETILSSLNDDVTLINDVIDKADNEIESVQRLIAQSDLTSICDSIDQLMTWIGDGTVDMSGSGSNVESEGLLEPESDNELVSGSGMGVSNSLSDDVSDLCDSVEGVSVEVRVCEGVVNTALNYSNIIHQEALYICSMLSETLERGGVAIEAILNYTSSIEAIDEAIRLANETRRVLAEVETLGYHDGESQLFNNSLYLLNKAEATTTIVNDVIGRLVSLESMAQQAQMEAEMAAELVESLQLSISTLSNITGTTLLQYSEDIHSIEASFNITTTTHSSILTLLTNLPSDASVVMATVNETASNFDLTYSIINSANATIMDVQSELMIRDVLLVDLEDVSVANGDELESLSSDLARLQEELERARRAAASIDVALRFHGNTSYAYNNTGLTSSTSATHISLVFNPSETTGLMLHSTTDDENQQTFSIQLENGSVSFTTEMGGVERVVEQVATPTGMIQENTWYQLFATRDSERSELTVSLLQEDDGAERTSHTVSLISSSSAVSLPSNGTLYLGGTSALVANGYSGCLDRVTINNAPISLLSPDLIMGESLQLCGPRPPSEAPRAMETGAWLQGGGSYVQVVSSLITGASPLIIELEFRTFASDGLLMIVYSDNMDQRLAVAVMDGRLSLQFSRDFITMATAESVGVVNDGQWHSVEVEMDNNTAFLLVDSNERINASTLMSLVNFNPSPEQFYIGGVPADVQVSIGSSELSLSGCVRYLQVASQTILLNSTHTSSRVSFGGCPSPVVAGVRFMGKGVAVLRPSTNDVEYISFQFHSTQLVAILLYIGDESDSVAVSLYHTRLRVDGLGTVLYSIQDGLNDDAWHSVVLVLGNDRMNLTVDQEMTVTTPIFRPHPQRGSDIFVGGVTPPTKTVINENFRGCINELVINNMLVDFTQAISLEGVALYGCSPESIPVTAPLPPPPPPPLPPPPSINPNISVGVNGQEGSFLAIPLDSNEVTQSHIISIQFQTSSPNAMLLYTQGNFDFLALELIRGLLYYTYNLGTGRIILNSTHTYNDGLEHTVDLLRDGRNGTMVIDGGVEIVSGESPGSFTSLNIAMEMLFVGGTPLVFPPTNLIRFRTTGEVIPPSTRGCILSLSINAVFINLTSPQASSGTEECLEFYTNIATFHGSGYLQLLDELSGGVDISMSIEFRTTTTQCTGLLLYIASSTHPDHLVLEIVDGLVRFVFDNGRSPTVIEYLPSSTLCDNQWHSISLVKDEITGALSVDGGDPVTAVSDVVNFVSLDLDSSLFVGGVPDTQSIRSTVISDQVNSSSFQGCIRNVYVSTSRTGPLERDLAQASESSDVTFHTCNP